ncbi:transposase [Clostridium estertheticum]|uniref:RNA-guided endonuclease InsQ/TnpB family protein n=1 Tax=Clostridium estertheticum TaxID=238834 RepID=UPI0013E98622|nr:RNA-guided endonuclease TnpB family protein [Clostridium estertheticum]MBZ9685746.1 transposase [Clostridium estertheticum]
MLRTYKTEINPTGEQRRQTRQSIGVCRYLYNFYLAENKELYNQFKNGLIDKKQAFMSANNFDIFINHAIKTQEEFAWINECGSKARKKAICNAETAFKRFFKGQSKFPNFKKKKNQDVKMYFPKNNKGDWTVERHRIKVPSLGWVQLKEKGYIPINLKVTSGTVSFKASRYYVSVLIDVQDTNDYSTSENQGIGIDLGIKDLAIVNTIEKPFKNINKTKEVKKLEKKLKREQRKLSRKYESLKARNKKIKKEGGNATRHNISKKIAIVQKLHQKLSNIRTNYVNQVINEIVKTKPSYITIEDLNVRGMMKNKHLAKAVAQQNFYDFRVKLAFKCKLNNIELRIVDRWYPSSKTCSNCESINKDLKLSDRMYVCPVCGLIIDRDKNASVNLANAKIYKVA